MNSMEPQRLQKILAHMGIASRRKAEEMILQGRVTVNRKKVTELGTKVIPGVDDIAVDGNPVSIIPPHIYIMLYKPSGWITSASDEKGRRTVLDLLDGVEERCYPIGRLDYNTSGLLLLTNDGELTNTLLHPSKEVEKVYLAEVSGVMTAAHAEKLRRGIRLEDGWTAPAKVKIIRQGEKGGKKTTFVQITIHEGRNRQVRRMFAALGFDTIHLKRIGFASLTLDGLKIGEWRYLTEAEVEHLRSLGTK